MPHYSVNKYQCYVYYLFIAMASISNSSPTDDNASGTDLSNIPTEEEEQIDTTDWTPAK